MALNHSPSIVTNGLIIYLDAGNTKSYTGSGTTWRDLSGSGNNGVLTSGPTFNGTNSGVIVFDGTNDHVVVNSNANILPTTAYTKSAWFYTTNLTTNNNLLSGNSGQHAFWLAGQNKVFGGHNGTWNYVTSTTTIAINTWYCATVTFNTTTGWELYINGNRESTSANTVTFTGTGDVLVGAAFGSGTNPFTGRIGNVSVYNRTLNGVEIKQNFNALRGRYGI